MDSIDQARSSFASRVSISVDPTADGIELASRLGLKFVELGPLEGTGLVPSQGVERTTITALAEALGSNGVSAESMHAPFLGVYDFGELDEAKREAAIRRHLRHLGYCYELGVKFYVVHPGGMVYGEWDEKRKAGVWPHDRSFSQRLWRINSEVLSVMARSAGSSGVRICLENVWFNEPSFMTVQDFAAIIDGSGRDDVGACVDVGHANIGSRANPSALLRSLGSRVWTVHLSDNDGLGDLHLPPGEGNVDWAGVIRSLAGISYAGTMNLETEPVEGLASLRRLLG